MNRDFRDLLAEFNAHGVEFLIVGAHALAAHGRVRATKDLDVWIRPDPENARRVLAAIRGFGAPLHDRFADSPVSILSKQHLLQNKRAAGRKQDLADVEWLEHQSH